MDLGPLLNAHAFLRVERPPVLWDVDVDDEPLVRAIGEMIAAALTRGTDLADVVMRVTNVTIESGPDADRPEPAPGEYVAFTIAGGGDWSPEVTWSLTDRSVTLLNPDLDAAARVARIPWASTRVTADGGSVTIFLHRFVDAA